VSNTRKTWPWRPPHEPPSRKLESAARRMYAKMQLVVDDADKVSWHSLAEDQKQAVRELFAAGLEGWNEAGP
jgi:hypothetical protein